MTIHYFYRSLLVASSFAMLTACAHAAPPELVQARTAYEQAAEGPSTKYTPAELHVAKTSLLTAERSFEDKEEEAIVRHQSYIAVRKAQLAETLARTEMYKLGLEWSENREEFLEDEDAAKTKAELANTQGTLANTQGALAHTQGALDDEEAANAVAARELSEEKRLRAEADKRAAQSAADLARIAAVKQDERGTVITLSGSVLFASNRSVLLPAAQAKLTQVAQALLAGDPAATFVVEGHTDSKGKADANQALSVSRANAVRDFLVQHEIAADRVSVQGYGEARSVGDNGNAEGRADNRRVEIVVKPGKSK
jgi:outer membrane protein OmpA-like peptidoglycan-associated protein